MMSDLITFISGRIPLGFWLPILLGVFASLTWLLVWAGTGFWERKQFWRVLTRIWVILIALYIAAWFVNPSMPVPTRILVTSGEDGNITDGDWVSTGVAELIRDGVNRSGKAFTLLDDDICPGLTGLTANSSAFDSLALRLKIRLLIDVQQKENTIVATMRRSGSKGYRVVDTFSRPVSAFRTDGYAIASDVMKVLGDNRSLSRSKIPYKSATNSNFRELFTALNRSSSDQPDSAFAAFQRLEVEYPTWQYLKRAYAKALIADGISANREHIRSLLKEAMAQDPSDGEGMILLGRIFLEFRDWEAAESSLKLGFNYMSSDPQLYFLLSRLDVNRLSDLKFHTHTSLLERALYLAPGYEDARLELAKYYMRQRSRVEARQTLEAGLAVDGRSIALRQSLSATLLELGKSAQAAQICEEIIAANPTHASAYYNLGIARIYLEDFEGGLAALDSSQTHGGSVDCYYYKGVALQRMGEWERAIKEFQMRFVHPKDNEDRVAISARERVQMLQRWIAERDSTDRLDN